MANDFIESSFTEILIVVGCLVTVLVGLRLVIGVARRKATHRTDVILKSTLDASPEVAAGGDLPTE